MFQGTLESRVAAVEMATAALQIGQQRGQASTTTLADNVGILERASVITVHDFLSELGLQPSVRIHDRRHRVGT